jgi:hypothetical protein
MKKQSGSSPQVEDEGRTARAAERRFKVVFKLLIFRLDLLFLLYQGKRKEHPSNQQIAMVPLKVNHNTITPPLKRLLDTIL